MFCKKFNMFGIFCNNKLVKTPICLLKFLSFFVKISELLVKNPEFFVKNLRFFGKIFNIFGKRNKHDVLLVSLQLYCCRNFPFTKLSCLLNPKT